MDAWQIELPKDSQDLNNGVAFSFTCGKDHEHVKDCVWIWHYCTLVLGPESVSPGSNFGWRPSGILAHDLVSINPLTVSPSVYWPDCCGKHGFVTNGQYADV